MGEMLSAVVKELSCHDYARYVCNNAMSVIMRRGILGVAVKKNVASAM